MPTKFGPRALVALIGLAVLAVAAMASRADARPPVPRLEGASLAEAAARCPPRFRRHTITGKCVRIQPRFPLLSWF